MDPTSPPSKPMSPRRSRRWRSPAKRVPSLRSRRRAKGDMTMKVVRLVSLRLDVARS